MNYPSWRVSEWQLDLPQGRIDKLYIHWSAHDYHAVFPAYHFCVALNEANEVIVVNTHDVRENMRAVHEAPDKPYAQHTRNRNSFALGIAVMGMQDSKPDDFGPYPLTEELLDALCLVGAKLAAHYNVLVDAEHIMTHAEAAVRDGYFGTEPEQRWDIARLKPDRRRLVPQDAFVAGNELRRRIGTHLRSLS
jgi:hypothetical protein